MKIDRERVFIVDDEAFVRDSISWVLEENGYLPVVMENVEAALSLNTPIHRIIIDIFMPGMGGIDGIAKIRELWPDAKIIAISGGYMGKSQEDALEASKIVGANSVLPKPFTGEVLLETLANLN